MLIVYDFPRFEMYLVRSVGDGILSKSRKVQLPSGNATSKGRQCPLHSSNTS